MRPRSRSKHFIFDYLRFSATLDPAEILAKVKVLFKLPDHNFSMRRDAYSLYPVRCDRCNGETGEATVVYDSDTQGIFSGPGSYGLGKGVCPTCKIRYSASNGVWKCWDMIADKGRVVECNCTVKAPDYICPQATSHVEGWAKQSRKRQKPNGKNEFWSMTFTKKLTV